MGLRTVDTRFSTQFTDSSPLGEHHPWYLVFLNALGKTREESCEFIANRHKGTSDKSESRASEEKVTPTNILYRTKEAGQGQQPMSTKSPLQSKYMQILVSLLASPPSSS